MEEGIFDMVELSEKEATKRFCPLSLNGPDGGMLCIGGRCLAWKETRAINDKEKWGYCEMINQGVSV